MYCNYSNVRCPYEILVWIELEKAVILKFIEIIAITFIPQYIFYIWNEIKKS